MEESHKSAKGIRNSSPRLKYFLACFSENVPIGFSCRITSMSCRQYSAHIIIFERILRLSVSNPRLDQKCPSQKGKVPQGMKSKHTCSQFPRSIMRDEKRDDDKTCVGEAHTRVNFSCHKGLWCKRRAREYMP